MRTDDEQTDGFSEYYYLKDYFESLGFPHIDDDAFADCGIIGLNGGCTRERKSYIQPPYFSYLYLVPRKRQVDWVFTDTN